MVPVVPGGRLFRAGTERRSPRHATLEASLHWILLVERSDEHELSIDAVPPMLDRLDLRFDDGRRITATPPIEVPYTQHPDERITDAVVAPSRLGLVINETVRAVFESLDIDTVQYFPARLRALGTDEVTAEYWIANVVGSVACVDPERSDLVLFDDGDRQFIDKLVLKPSVAAELGHIFRLAEFPPALVISDELTRSLERADVIGLGIYRPEEFSLWTESGCLALSTLEIPSPSWTLSNGGEHSQYAQCRWATDARAERSANGVSCGRTPPYLAVHWYNRAAQYWPSGTLDRRLVSGS